MGFTLLQDEPSRRRRTFVTVALFLSILLSGGGLGYALRGIVCGSGSSRPVILLMGDSLTEYGSNVTARGWVSQLQAEYARSADVLNRGFAGRSTRSFLRGVLPKMRKDLSGWRKPSLITVWLGANDAADPAGRHAYLHVPLDEYRKNLARILNDLHARAPNAKILLLTPPPVDTEKRSVAQVQAGDQQNPPDHVNLLTGSYGDACKAVGDTIRGVTTLDVFGYIMTTFPNTTQRGELLVDGLHFTSAGNDVIFQLVDQQIQKLLPDLGK